MFFRSADEKKARKEQKTLDKKQEELSKLRDANAARMEIERKNQGLDAKIKNEKWLSGELDAKQLEKAIGEAKENLYVQREKLARRLFRANKEYTYITETMPEGPKRQKELKRCSTTSKNAFYALTLVDETIERLEEAPSEYEWRQIMKSLTNGYKMVNKISVGPNRFARLSFLMNKAKYDMKGKASIASMENYFGKPIDELLDETNVEEDAADIIINDKVMAIQSDEELQNAIYTGEYCNVSPTQLVAVASEQSEKAESKGVEPVIENPFEIEDSIQNLDVNELLDSLPGNSF